MSRKEACAECGKEVAVRVSSRDAPYAYEIGGLPNVELIGVKIVDCPTCGEGVEIPRLGQLHRVIAHSLFHKPGLLDGKEVRFLRSNAGMMAKDFASFLGLTPFHLSKVETGKIENLGETADKLARLVANAPCANTEEYIKFLRSSTGKKLKKSKKAADEVVYELKGSGWSEAA